MKVAKGTRILLKQSGVLLSFLIPVTAGIVFQSWARADTVALWLFDEQVGICPSCVLSDAAKGTHPIVLGLGGQVVKGKYGNALEPIEQAKIKLSLANRYTGFERRPKRNPSRKVEPMDWANADFCALMTRGEDHLRKEVGFGSPTDSRLNLADFDWTVEFWYLPTRQTESDGVVLEIGEGPRGENDHVTQLLLNADGHDFALINQPSETRLLIPSNAAALSNQSTDWRHLAFVYDASSRQLRHYVDGHLQRLPEKCRLKPLPPGVGDYLSIGRDGFWQRPLPGRIDELRLSDAQLYKSNFTPPTSYSKFNRETYKPPRLKAGPPLLFAEKQNVDEVVPLGGRKYLFIDDAIVAGSENVSFNVNPPRLAERVLNKISGHLVVWEDDDGLIRLYYNAGDRRLGVLTSRDGIHWEVPDLRPKSSRGRRNIVIDDPVGLGTIFVDPNSPPDERIKYLSGYDGRAIYVYTSPDGFHFKRNETAALPFRGASQSIAYYDDQRQKYVAFHRTDMPETAGGHTERAFVMTETTDPMRPWPFRPISLEEELEIGKHRRIGTKLPWYLDNGPLTPPGFGVEYPTIFAAEDSFDPLATDVYVPKNVKYAWAPDAYLAFPLMYFHYHDEGPATRQELGRRERDRGSGPVETQFGTSRDGVHWMRYPRPAYIGIGRHDGLDLHKSYIAHGMVRRGDEIWQYYLGSEQYHSSWSGRGREAVFRVVQRFDGFVSADTPYTGGSLTTRPLVFKGDRLVLNIDTGATGYAQVGFVDQHGEPINGFSVEDCVYINGDFIDTEVEWLNKGSDVSSLAGRPVSMVIRSRGTKLYSLQFVSR
ncbi:MAG TPA: LamG domain-containing protein [Lacipirellulaceae bacterium]|nr:LamG domain-containing protein [Lacipirellulaceae bacterium]